MSVVLMAMMKNSHAQLSPDLSPPHTAPGMQWIRQKYTILIDNASMVVDLHASLIEHYRSLYFAEVLVAVPTIPAPWCSEVPQLPSPSLLFWCMPSPI
ncbi:unnamed protein product [Phytomonas sp. Hart1]|nr:unnamed protein product [Phytomonas sp. Hart1]|eukprot:CCW70278.1 unnamed protein product [Phytomonas sp. isolate Hart1]